MFGGGGGGENGDFWAGIPMELGPPAYAAPYRALPVPPPGPFLHQYHPALVSPPPPPPPRPAQAMWTATENRVFEVALVEFEEGRPDRWQRIAERIPGKTPWDVAEHYGRLERDLRDIEAGVIELPEYADDCVPRGASGASGVDQEQQQRRVELGGSRAKADERKKGTPWTPEEHARFLEGLEKYGKGDWRSISRNSVVTRTPTQVASHAQKFFLRQSSAGKKERRRSSIHDVVRP